MSQCIYAIFKFIKKIKDLLKDLLRFFKDFIKMLSIPIIILY